MSYFGAALLLVVALVPSVLRQSPPETSETAALSPDAPPDDAVESIISSLNLAVTGTAGSGDGEGPGPETVAAGPLPPSIRCRGYGNPPRQTESLYSAPCVAPFTGDNGGATSWGVTADEFRVTVYLASGDTSPDGPVDQPPPPGQSETPTRRRLRAFQQYFNQSYQFYGRQMRIQILKVTGSGVSEPEGRAQALRAKEELNTFAAVDLLFINHGLADESIRRGIITVLGQHTRSFLTDRAPYAWTFLPSTSDMADMGGELVCKNLAGKPPSYNHRMDPSFDYSKPRVFGAIIYEDANHSTEDDEILAALARCDVHPEPIIRYNLAESQGTGAAQTAGMAQFKAAGVTSIILLSDLAAVPYFAGQATQSGYYPEWISYGAGFTDNNVHMRNTDQSQWQNAIGISFNEIERNCEYYDDYRAFRSVDPDGPFTCADQYAFGGLQLIANGVQLAGPRLTPQTFEAGLFEMPRRAPDPAWSLGGGFAAPDDRAFVDYASLVWWDKDATGFDGELGAYRHVFGGRRFRRGEIPTGHIPFQEGGIVTPANPDPSPEQQQQTEAEVDR